MEVDLPPYEDIYDFNEQDLNFYFSKITSALTQSENYSEKWQRKAKRIIELIEIELEERISVNQISSFCNKELSSELYNEISNEDPQPLNEVKDTQDDVSEKIWNMRKNKKTYKDFVKNTLKNTQQSTGLKIGGSSVPIVKVNKPDEIKAKPKVDIKDKMIQKVDAKNDMKKVVQKKLEKTTGKIGKSGKNEEKVGVKAKAEIRVDDKKKIETKRDEQKKEGVIKEEVKRKEIIQEKNTLNADKDFDGKTDVSEEHLNQTGSKIELETPSYSGPLLPDIIPKANSNVIKSTLKSQESTHRLIQEPLDVLEDFKNLPASPIHSDNPKLAENCLNTTSPSHTRISRSFPTEQPAELLLNSEKSHSHPLPYHSNTSFSCLANIDTCIDSSSQKLPQLNLTESSVPYADSSVKNYPHLHSSDTSISNVNSSETSMPDPKLLSSPPINLSSPPALTLPSKDLTIRTTKSNMPDSSFPLQDFNSSSSSLEEGPSLVIDQPQPERYIRKTLPTTEKYEPDVAGLSELRALKEKLLKQAIPQPKDSVPEAKTIQKKTSAPKLPAKPKPKPLPDNQIDYSQIYDSFFDIFAGHKVSKDFNLLTCLREVHSTFKDFVSLLDSPEFEVHRKFKLTLAPLEINPRDLVRGEETAIPTLPSDKEMYYRVVKARPEVYDIVSRGFNKKKGWSELPHGMNLRLSWNVMWTWSKPSLDFAKMLIWQQVNHFPETKNFSRKDMLKKNIEKIMKVSQKAQQMWNIIPLTYVLPKEYLQFVDSYGKQEETDPGSNVWIMKPVGKSRGRGISVVNDVNQVSYGEIMIIQRYITNPLLLEGFKFDLRLYILITSFSPLEAFLYQEGFARMSTVPFSMNPDKLHNKFIHLTNSSIQKHNQNMKNDSLDTMLGGSKICLKTLKERLGKLNINWENIWQQIIELVLKSLIAVQGEIPSFGCCFDLVGYDVMIDQNLQTWLVEINSSPSLARENYLDDLIKQQLIDDTLELVNPIFFNKNELLKVLERRISEGQKGQFNNSASQMNADLNKILEGKKPRKFGEIPQKLGNFQPIAPSALCEKFYKIANPRG